MLYFFQRGGEQMPFAKEILSHWRREEGITQAQAAEKIGVTQVYYCQLENGKRTPSLDVLENIAQATCLNLSDLMQIPNPAQPPSLKTAGEAGAKRGAGAVSE